MRINQNKVYLLNAQTEIDWILDKTPNTILLSELFIITVEPDGTTTNVQAQNYVAPTATEEGLVTHFITPDSEGIWSITLVKGNVDTNTKLGNVVLSVFDNLTVVAADGVSS